MFELNDNHFEVDFITFENSKIIKISKFQIPKFSNVYVLLTDFSDIRYLQGLAIQLQFGNFWSYLGQKVGPIGRTGP